MPNLEHVARLVDSVEEWNSWRTSKRISPDLTEAKLNRANLTLANLSGANLTEAKLNGTDLSGADLTNADLTKADLHWAKLIEANLSGANLRNIILWGADLTEAKLNKANLNAAILTFAHLSKADLSNANLTEANLRNADLTEADLTEADLSNANLTEAKLNRTELSKAHLALANLSKSDLSNASLTEADLRGANFTKADLTKADLTKADLTKADLTKADLTEAKLIEANLTGAVLIQTDLTKANLAGCGVYGLSAWDVQLEGTIQSNLIITPPDAPKITVDNLAVAQFIYLLLNNKNVRHVIDTITSKVVLILGRFTPERKIILEAIRDELRKRNYLPVLFDFEGPSNRDITETVSTLAHMAKFVIADITNAKSIPQELKTIVPNLPSVPVQPLLLASQEEYGMFEHFSRFPWVLEPYLYDDQEGLLAVLTDKVIGPAERKAKEQTGR